MTTDTTQFKGTPGPWEDHGGIVMGNGGLNNVALAYTYRDEMTLTKANARLIAAAPELLEALIKVTRYAEAVRINMGETPEEYFDAMHEAIAAIAKALGTS